MNNEERTGVKSKLPVIIVISVIVIALAVMIFLIMRVHIVPEVKLEAGQTPQLEAFFEGKVPESAEFCDSISDADARTPGSYMINLRVRGRSYTSTLTVVDTIAPKAKALTDAETWLNVEPSPESCITAPEDATKVSVSWKEAPDVTKGGIVPGVVLLKDAGGNTAEIAVSVLVLTDTGAPVIEGVHDHTVLLGKTVDYSSGVTVTDDYDKAPSLTVSGKVDFKTVGSYTVTYTASDASGNTSVKSCVVRVVEDKTAPRISASNFSVYLGDSVSYLSKVSVSDDFDPDPKVTVDKSKVNLKKLGSYDVTYTATDSSGNTRSVTVKLKVVKRATKSDEVEKMSKAVLKSIITDSMSDVKKVNAIYKWIKNNIGYTGYSDKSDWIIAAYDGLKNRGGDCYTFFAISKALLTQAGIENIQVTKVPTPSAPTNHYWNLVYVNGGWYHMDSTPFHKGSNKLCLLTDKELAAYDKKTDWLEHKFDESLYPERAKTSLQKQISY